MAFDVKSPSNTKAMSSGILHTPNIKVLDSDINGAEAHHSQMSCGVFEAKLQRVVLKNAVFDSGLYNQRVSFLGILSSDVYVLSLLPTPQSKGHINKTALTSGAWISQPGDEFHGNIPAEFHWFAFSIQQPALEERLEVVGLDPAKLSKLGTGSVITQAGLKHLEQTYNSLYFDACVAGEVGYAESIEEKLVFAYLDAIGASPSRHVGGRIQPPVLKRVEDYLRTNLDRPITTTELCSYLGCSRRQLEIAFKNAYGMGPVTYHRRLRINEVRRCLLVGERKQSAVSYAACDFGFSHLGRFSADYKSLFGESPRQTVMVNKKRTLS